MTSLTYNPADPAPRAGLMRRRAPVAQPPEIVITGFPKCGTTALVRGLEAREDVTYLRPASGAAEMPWPQIRDIRFDSPAGQVVAHKNATYVYNKKALEHLAAVNPNSVIVLCIRDPLRALVSWHRMHQSIATRGNDKTHFAWIERTFYATADVESYYRRYAADRLRYGIHFQKLCRIIGDDARIVVVDQQRLAADTDTVVDFLLARARGQDVPLTPPPGGAARHEGFADRQDIALDPRITTRLANTWDNLQAAIGRTNVTVCR